MQLIHEQACYYMIFWLSDAGIKWVSVHFVFDRNLEPVFASSEENCCERKFEFGVHRCLLSLVNCTSNIYLEFYLK